jgi:hypothetical protein
MDNGNAVIWGVIVGGLIGTFSTLAATVLKHHLETKRATSFAAVRKKRLMNLLFGPKFVWRSMSMLSSAIGADEETTASLLLEIEARRSLVDGSEDWALISRAPFPDDLQSN